MKGSPADHKIRGFRLTVHPTEAAYGVTLDETNGQPEHTTLVGRVDEAHTRAILGSVMNAVKASGHARTILGPHRKAPITLTDEAGVKLALVVLATDRVSKPRRIELMLGGIENMATEEAYYWYAKCVGPDARRVRKALRIFLAEE